MFRRLHRSVVSSMQRVTAVYNMSADLGEFISVCDNKYGLDVGAKYQCYFSKRMRYSEFIPVDVESRHI